MSSFIVVDDAQAKVISEATDCVEIRDQKGNQLGVVASGFSAADLAVAQQRFHSNSQRFTTQEVLNHLQTLVQQ